MPALSMISERIRKLLVAQVIRTGVGPKELVHRDESRVLDDTMIKGWINGRIEEAEQSNIDKAFDLWRALPSAEREKIPANPPTKTILGPDVVLALREIREYSDISPEKLIDYCERVGILPDGLTAGMVKGWLAGNAKEANTKNLVFVSELWQNLCDEDKARIPLSESDMRLLLKYKELGLLPYKALKDDPPKDLSIYQVRSWLSGEAKRVRKAHLEWVVAQCEKLLKSSAY